MEATPGQIAQKTKTPRVKGEFIVVNSVDAEKFIRRARIWKLINALIQVKNRTVAHGMDATGVSLAQMNLLDITENIQERNRSNAFIVIVVFQGRTILLYIWKDTRSKEKSIIVGKWILQFGIHRATFHSDKFELVSIIHEANPRWPKCTAIPVQQGTCDFSAISFCKELDKNGEYMAQHGRKHFGGFICERVCLI